MFLTKEGILTESTTHVYVSDDKEYYHTNASIVKIYENFKIKDFDKLIPNTYDYKGQIFEYPEINGYENIISYNLKMIVMFMLILYLILNSLLLII